MSKVYGFSLLSVLAMVIVAVLNPSKEGSNVTWKVVFAEEAIEFEGIVVTVKSAKFAPEIIA